MDRDGLDKDQVLKEVRAANRELAALLDDFSRRLRRCDSATVSSSRRLRRSTGEPELHDSPRLWARHEQNVLQLHEEPREIRRHVELCDEVEPTPQVGTGPARGLIPSGGPKKPPTGREPAGAD